MRFCVASCRNWKDLWDLVCLCSKRCNCKRRNYLSNWSEETAESSGNSHAEQTGVGVPRWQRGSIPTTSGNARTTLQRNILTSCLNHIDFIETPDFCFVFLLGWLGWHCQKGNSWSHFTAQVWTWAYPSLWLQLKLVWNKSVSQNTRSFPVLLKHSGQGYFCGTAQRVRTTNAAESAVVQLSGVVVLVVTFSKLLQCFCEWRKRKCHLL